MASNSDQVQTSKCRPSIVLREKKLLIIEKQIKKKRKKAMKVGDKVPYDFLQG
jgi:hypothetical protein